MRNIPDEFIVPKEKRVSAAEEKLPPCWVVFDSKPESNQKTLSKIGERIWQSTSSGEFRLRVANLIGQAKDVICASSFLISDQSVVDAFLRAATNGVRVYLLTSQALLLMEVREDDDFDAKRIDEHKEILRRLAGRVLVRTSANFHSKFIICDPLRPDARGLLLTANLNEEALVRNQEIGVELDSLLANDLYKQFMKGFSTMSENELLSSDNVIKARAFPRVELSDPRLILCTVGEIHTLREAAKQLLENSLGQVVLSTYAIDGTHDFAKALSAAAKQGKEIRLLVRLRDKRSNMEALISLAQAGVKIRAHRFLHGKSIVAHTAEGSKGIVMTANFEQHGLDDGFESGVTLEGKDSEDLKQLLEQWWEDAPYEFVLDLRRNQVAGKAILWQNEKLIEVSIQKKFDQYLGELHADTFEEMSFLEPKAFPRPSLTSTNNTLHLEYHYSWRVMPPVLPNDAVQTKDEEDFPIYKKENEKFVMIKHNSEFKRAQELANKIGAKVVA